MNCSIIANCFNNKTAAIVDELVERTEEMYATPGTLRNIRLLFPVIISIGVFDHIIRAVNLSRYQVLPHEAPMSLRWLDFKYDVLFTLLFSVSDLPNFFNWFEKKPILISVAEEVYNYTCSAVPIVIDNINEYSVKLNANSNYFGSFFASLIAASVVLMVAIHVHQNDARANEMLPHFKAHRMNYYFTYASIAAFFIFQTYLLARFDLRYPPVSLEKVLMDCT